MGGIQESIEILRKSRCFSTEEEFFEEIFRALLEKRPELRIELAVEQFETGDVSLYRAAKLSRYSPQEFKEALQARGIDRDIASLMKTSVRAALKASNRGSADG